MTQRILACAAVVAALTSSACVVGPKYAKPATPVAASFKEPLPTGFKEAKGWKAGEPKDDLHRGKWWEIYGDPALNALEEQIDVSNQTLAGAEAQFRSCRGPPGSAWSGRAAARRGLVLLHLEAVEPSRDVPRSPPSDVCPPSP